VRVKLGLSQSQLARMLGYTQAAISMAEAGRRPQMARRLFEAARRIRPDLQPEPSQGNPS
jgi:transcriptional regulator with XRE-family HTH domain